MLLHVDASPRDGRSRSRPLAGHFVAAWRHHHPGEDVVVRDIGRRPPPFVSEAWIEGAFAPPATQSPSARATIAISDAYVDELLAASHLLISTPMHNFCCPAHLKAWIDQIVRVDRTVALDGEGFRGLVVGTRATVLVTCSRDPRPGGRVRSVSFLEPYLRAILAFIGIDDVEVVYAHSQNPALPSPAAELLAARTRRTARVELERLGRR